jgi:hypothetical protein
MVGVNKRTNCPVFVIDDLDSTIRDVTFDCFVLNRYGNYDKIAPYNYLHANVIDIHSVCTITITFGGSLINFHKDKFTKGNHLKIENFTFLTRANTPPCSLMDSIACPKVTIVEGKGIGCAPWLITFQV